MHAFLSRALSCAAIACFIVPVMAFQPANAATDVLARIRERGHVTCATVVRPGIAVPTVDGAHWYGVAPDVCRAVAAAVLGNPNKIVMRPYFDATGRGPNASDADDIVFLAAEEMLSRSADVQPSLELGPVVVHDAVGVLVHASGPNDIASLTSQSVCAEPGTQADRALTRYFAARSLPLHEHPFQETDEMRQAYATGNCDALAGPLSALASIRADPTDGRPEDRILGDMLADDPIFAATPADARWSRIVWWTFSALVDAEDAGTTSRNVANAPIPGVPPAIGTSLGLASTWARDAISACGSYGEIFDRNLGARSRFRLVRGANALWRNGGLIYGLRIE